MNKHIFNYGVYPSVVPADTVSDIVIHPLGENTQFVPGVSYTVEVRGVETFCNNYAQLPWKWYNVTPNDNGDLVIHHFFEGEQRYALKLIRPEEDLNATPYRDITNRGRRHDNKEAILYVYSLDSDLYGLRGYKGELHCHTYESDGIQDVAHTVGNYRAAGYDFLAITDHYITMSAEKAMAMPLVQASGVTTLLGEECHVPTEQIHVVHIGGSASVNAYFREHPEAAKAEMMAIHDELNNLPANIDKVDYAWRVWIARKAAEFGGISILTHPHWIWFETYFMASAITQQLIKDGVYNAMDITDQEADTTVALWSEMRAQGHTMPVVGCSDSHENSTFDCNKPVRGGYTMVFAPSNSRDDLLTAIKGGRSIAVNAVGSPERVQGPYRFVKFARFLLDNYYPMYMRLCRGQGVLLADYAIDHSPTILDEVTAAKKRIEEYARKFYGY